MGTNAELAPPAFLQLAGHPLRWRLLGELGRSDRTVQELTGLVGEPQNLVSYHLGKLRDARLVSSRRSSADRRGSYYALDLARVRSLLAASGTALHAGLRLVPPAPPQPPPAADRDDAGASPAPTARVLFLCTGNSARSQMAEALVQARSGGLVEARSAGSHPKALHPLAVRTMRDDYGIDLAGRRAKHVSVFADERFDRVVTLCDRVREVCPDVPGDPVATHWSIPDPAAGLAPADGDRDDGPAGLAAFRQVAAELATRTEFLLAALTGPAEPSPTTPQEGR